MSAEELKIRDELERDIERDLEEEIKDGIYHLALRLHRLYQHQKERMEREVPNTGSKNQQGMKKKTLSELNINIKMEGGTKIEIKEVKKEGDHHGGRLKGTSYSEDNNKINAEKSKGDNKEFNWMKTLRSNGNKNKIEINSTKPKLRKSVPVFHENPNVNKIKREYKNAGVDHKIMELGWKE